MTALDGLLAVRYADPSKGSRRVAVMLVAAGCLRGQPEADAWRQHRGALVTEEELGAAGDAARRAHMRSFAGPWPLLAPGKHGVDIPWRPACATSSILAVLGEKDDVAQEVGRALAECLRAGETSARRRAAETVALGGSVGWGRSPARRLLVRFMVATRAARRALRQPPAGRGATAGIPRDG